MKLFNNKKGGFDLAWKSIIIWVMLGILLFIVIWFLINSADFFQAYKNIR